MIKKFFWMVSIGVLLFSGCATTELETKAVMTRTIVLNPIKSENRKLYLEVHNTAASKIDLKPDLLKELKKRGLVIVADPSIATYILNVNVLFADNIKEAYAIKNAAKAGIATGVVAGVARGSIKNGLVAGAVAAVAVGVVSSAMEDSIYRAVIDISLKERRSNVSGQTEDFDKDFIEKKSRVLVSAVKMGLDIDRAIPILEEKASKMIAGIF